MNQQRVIERTSNYVRKALQGDSSGHDWWHVYRVHQLSKTIARDEYVDLYVVELGALLHDIGDWKFNAEGEGERKSRKWLSNLGVDITVIDQVCEIVENVSFKGADVKPALLSPEGMVVQDADRLDAMGAIGIARAFAYGGSKGRAMYDPNVKPVMHGSFAQYKSSTGHTVAHFYEKLLLLKDRMNTMTGKRLAESRHEFMQEYLKQFFGEWKGEI